MRKEFKPVTLEEIESVWGNADFGHGDKIGIVSQGLLKCASGWAQGHTSACILRELRLITNGYMLTERGKKQLWEWFTDKEINL